MLHDKGRLKVPYSGGSRGVSRVSGHPPLWYGKVTRKTGAKLLHRKPTFALFKFKVTDLGTSRMPVGLHRQVLVISLLLNYSTSHSVWDIGKSYKFCQLLKTYRDDISETVWDRNTLLLITNRNSDMLILICMYQDRQPWLSVGVTTCYRQTDIWQTDDIRWQ